MEKREKYINQHKFNHINKMDKKLLIGITVLLALIVISNSFGDLSIKGMAYRHEHPVMAFLSDTTPFMLFALIITIVLESVVAFIMQKIKFKNFNLKRLIEFVVIVNIITVSILNVVMYFVSIYINNGTPYLITFEVLITLFEAYFIYYFNKDSINLKDSLILSTLMNLTSFFGGLAILYFLGF